MGERPKSGEGPSWDGGDPQSVGGGTTLWGNGGTHNFWGGGGTLMGNGDPQFMGWWGNPLWGNGGLLTYGVGDTPQLMG